MSSCHAPTIAARVRASAPAGSAAPLREEDCRDRREQQHEHAGGNEHGPERAPARLRGVVGSDPHTAVTRLRRRWRRAGRHARGWRAHGRCRGRRRRGRGGGRSHGRRLRGEPAATGEVARWRGVEQVRPPEPAEPDLGPRVRVVVRHGEGARRLVACARREADGDACRDAEGACHQGVRGRELHAEAAALARRTRRLPPRRLRARSEGRT